MKSRCPRSTDQHSGDGHAYRKDAADRIAGDVCRNHQHRHDLAIDRRGLRWRTICSFHSWPSFCSQRLLPARWPPLSRSCGLPGGALRTAVYRNSARGRARSRWLDGGPCRILGSSFAATSAGPIAVGGGHRSVRNDERLELKSARVDYAGVFRSHRGKKRFAVGVFRSEAVGKFRLNNGRRAYFLRRLAAALRSR
jgi:hypothetical protein